MNKQIIKKIYRILLLQKMVGEVYRIDSILFHLSLAWQIVFSKQNKRAFLFGSPNHRNMGDQAQTYCIQKWINKNYADYKVIIFNQDSAKSYLVKLLQKNMAQEDMIFFHSGYHLTDLYPVKDIYCKVVSLFPTHKIVVFPQTVNFIFDKKDEEQVAQIFNGHGNITLLCRDEFSYETAKEIFINCKLYLYPDIVTSLIGTKTNDNSKRNGVLFCMRNDVEAFYSKEQKTAFFDKFADYRTSVADTTISTPYLIIRRKREKVLNSLLEKFAEYQLVITDRYHGTIFSLVANTPVIVISSTDHKLSSGVKWFPGSFKDYVFYAENLDIAYEKAVEILNNKNYNYQLPAYFEQNYYSRLKSLLENDKAV